MERRLTTIDELIAFYPYKSRDVQVKEIRLQLLPVAKAYLAWRQVRKYSPADNERHVYRGLAEDRRAGAEAHWQALEPFLFEALAVPHPAVRDIVFDLMVRGRQLFLHQPVRHAAPLTLLVDRVIAATGERLPATAMSELRALAALFPPPDLARLKLKSDLYEIAQLGRAHGQHVKDEFIAYLLREAPDIMRAMPGFRAAGSERFGKRRVPTRDEASPLIHKLLRRDAGALFVFLTLRRDSAHAAPVAPMAGARR